MQDFWQDYWQNYVDGAWVDGGGGRLRVDKYEKDKT